jgi:hypothetical protein
MHRVSSPAEAWPPRPVCGADSRHPAVASPGARPLRAQGVAARCRATPIRSHATARRALREGPQTRAPARLSVAIHGPGGRRVAHRHHQARPLSTQSGRLGLVSIPARPLGAIPNRGNERSTRRFYGMEGIPCGGPHCPQRAGSKPRPHLRPLCGASASRGSTASWTQCVAWTSMCRNRCAPGLRPPPSDEPILLELEPGPAHLDGAWPSPPPASPHSPRPGP